MPPRVNMLDTMTGSGYKGNYFCNTQFGTPSGLAWVAQNNKTPLTVLRLLPEVDADGELPMFLNVDGIIQPSYWMVRARAWRGCGSPRCTFIAHDPFSGTPFDEHTSPPALICKAVSGAIKNLSAPPLWGKLVNDGALPKTSYLPNMGICQALIYFQYDSFSPAKGSADGERVIVVEMSDAASKLLMTTLAQSFLPNSTELQCSGDVMDFVNATTYGDVVGLQSPDAKFICLGPDTIVDFDQALGLAAPQRQQRAGSIGGRRAVTSAGPGAGGGQHKNPNYAIKLYSEFEGQSPVYTPEEAQLLMDRAQPWDQVLRVLSVDEQIQQLSKCVPWDVLQLAWSDFPDWIPARGTPAYNEGHATTQSAGGYVEDQQGYQDPNAQYDEYGNPIEAGAGDLPPVDDVPPAPPAPRSGIGGSRQPVPGPTRTAPGGLRGGASHNDPAIAARAAQQQAPTRPARTTMGQAAGQVQQTPARQTQRTPPPSQRPAR